MGNIPTVEEFILNEYEAKDINTICAEPEHIKWMMNQHAKRHVKAALEAAAKNAKVETRTWGSQYSGDWTKEVERASILNSYPESNIK